MSLAIATSILRIVAACWASLESNWSRSSLVTPSTMVGDVGAEARARCRSSVTRGVLDRVVQQRGGERDVVEAEVGEDHRDAERVRDVRLARAAHLVAVRVAGDLVGVLDQRGVGPAVALEVGVDQRGELGVDGVWRRQGSTERRSVRTSTRSRRRSVVLIVASTTATGAARCSLRRSRLGGARQRRCYRRCCRRPRLGAAPRRCRRRRRSPRPWASARGAGVARGRGAGAVAGVGARRRRRRRSASTSSPSTGHVGRRAGDHRRHRRRRRRPWPGRPRPARAARGTAARAPSARRGSAWPRRSTSRRR